MCGFKFKAEFWCWNLEACSHPRGWYLWNTPLPMSPDEVLGSLVQVRLPAPWYDHTCSSSVLQVRDQEVPIKRNFVRVIIHVDNCNLHPPQFSSIHYEAEVLDSAVVGTEIMQVRALDQDQGANAEIHYSLQAGENHLTRQFRLWTCLHFHALASGQTVDQLSLVVAKNSKWLHVAKMWFFFFPVQRKYRASRLWKFSFYRKGTHP